MLDLTLKAKMHVQAHEAILSDVDPFDAVVGHQLLRFRSLSPWENLYTHPWACKEVTHPAAILDDVALARESHSFKLLGK
ncbi:hypothetical protein CFBP6762_00564 [Xanthomonas arboricola pv. fragariae]|nr:hypothetical protein CFBP6762_00564 [Xanthomonas arboricola pv. fragariae]